MLPDKTKKLFFLLLLSFFTIVKGESNIKYVILKYEDETLLANVNAKINLSKEIIEAIQSGITLTFKYEFKIKSEKWYQSQSLIKVTKDYIFNFNRLTNTYTISNPVTFNSEEFANLFSAITFMESVHEFPITVSSQLTEDHNFIDIQFILANDNLHSFIRIERIFNDNWDINSGWSQWKLP